MRVKVTCNHLLLLLFYTYFLAAWVGDFSFPWFFSQGFPFTDIAKFHFTSTVSPGSILGRVRRDHKEKWKIETIQIQQEYSPSSERTFLFSYGWDSFSSLPCLDFPPELQIHTVRATFPQRCENEGWMYSRFRGWWEQKGNILLLSVLTSIASFMFI